MNSERSGEFPQVDFSSPVEFKPQGLPQGLLPCGKDPPATKSALNHRLRKLVELGQARGEGAGPGKTI